MDQEITRVNIWCDSDDLWYYAAWSGDEHDHNGQCDLDETATARDAIAWAQSQFSDAVVSDVANG